ncbi:hypothetical protein LTR28_011632, partial [Elasticomyces elasticus]
NYFDLTSLSSAPALPAPTQNPLNPSKPADLEALAARPEAYAITSTMREHTPFPTTLLARLQRLKAPPDDGEHARRASTRNRTEIPRPSPSAGAGGRGSRFSLAPPPSLSPALSTEQRFPPPLFAM